MRLPIRYAIAALALFPIAVSRAGQPGDPNPAYGMRLEGFAYPWPVAQYRFASQDQTLEMAYMDVKPARPNGGTAVLLHGKNFCAATWQDTIRVLVDAGYRVIAPDQIGFCKSSKPAIPVQLSAIGRQHACFAGIAGRAPRDHDWPLHRRDACHPLCSDVSGRGGTTGAGGSHRAGGLEGARGAMAECGCLVSARAEDHGEQHSVLRARHLLRQHMGANLRALGANAGRHVSGNWTRPSGVGLGPALRHDLFAAGGL